MSVGTAPLARKRGAGDSPRKSPDPEPREVLFSVKGRKSWLEWVDRLADFDRSNRVELIDRALARYAREIGFDEQPPER
jgi:hypothetical protein